MCDTPEFWAILPEVTVSLFLVAVFFIGLFWGLSKVFK